MANAIVTLSGRQSVVAIGAGAATASAAQAAARANIAQEASAAAIIAAASRGTYASTAAGLSATTNGQYFYALTGTAPNKRAKLYLNDAGSAVEQSELVTPSQLADNSAAAGIGTSTGETVEKVAATARRAVEAADITTALTAAAAGQKIILDRAYTLSSALTLTQTADMHIEVLPGASITYTGASHLSNFIIINQAGFNLLITGAPRTLAIKSNGKANSCFEARQTNAGATPICRLEALDCQDARMVSSTTSAVGMAFFGQAHVSFVGVRAKNITRAAGTGSSGSRGSFGIVAAESGALYPASVELIDWIADTIQTDDAAGNAARLDCDGCVLKVADNTGNRIFVDRGVCIETMGRDVKLQGLGANAIVETHSTTQSVRPITGGCPVVDFQTERGRVGKIIANYSGANVHLEKITVVDISPRTSGNPYQRYFGDVDIVDDSSGSYGLWAVYGATPQASAVSGGKKHVTRTGKVNQRGKAVRHLIDLGNTAAMDHSVFLDGFSGEISNAAISVGAAPTGTKSYFSNIRNIGTTVVAAKRSDGVSMGYTWGFHYDMGGNLGIYTHDGNYAAASTASTNGPSILDPRMGLYFSGDSRAAIGPGMIYAGSVAASETVNLGKLGYSGFAGMIAVRTDSSSDGYQSTWSFTGTTIAQIYSQNSLFIQSGSVAAPVGTASKIELWKDSGTNELKITNNYATAQLIFVSRLM